MAYTRRNMKKTVPLTFNLHPKGAGRDEKCDGIGIWALVEENPGEEVGGFEAMLRKFTEINAKEEETKNLKKEENSNRGVRNSETFF